jgi:hypothetical protein
MRVIMMDATTLTVVARALKVDLDDLDDLAAVNAV